MIDLEWIFSVSILLTANSQKLIYSIQRINSHSRLLSCVLPYTKQNGLKASFLFHKRLRLLRALRRYSIVNVHDTQHAQRAHCQLSSIHYHYMYIITSTFLMVLQKIFTSTFYFCYIMKKIARSGILYFWSENCQTIQNFLTIFIFGGLAY